MSKENLQQLIQEKILAAQLLEKQYGEFIPKSARSTLQKIVAAFTKSIASDGTMTTSIQTKESTEDITPEEFQEHYANEVIDNFREAINKVEIKGIYLKLENLEVIEKKFHFRNFSYKHITESTKILHKNLSSLFANDALVPPNELRTVFQLHMENNIVAPFYKLNKKENGEEYKKINKNTADQLVNNLKKISNLLIGDLNDFLLLCTSIEFDIKLWMEQLQSNLAKDLQKIQQTAISENELNKIRMESGKDIIVDDKIAFCSAKISSATLTNIKSSIESITNKDIANFLTQEITENNSYVEVMQHFVINFTKLKKSDHLKSIEVLLNDGKKVDIYKIITENISIPALQTHKITNIPDNHNTNINIENKPVNNVKGGTTNVHYPEPKKTDSEDKKEDSKNQPLITIGDISITHNTSTEDHKNVIKKYLDIEIKNNKNLQIYTPHTFIGQYSFEFFFLKDNKSEEIKKYYVVHDKKVNNLLINSNLILERNKSEENSFVLTVGLTFTRNSEIEIEHNSGQTNSEHNISMNSNLGLWVVAFMSGANLNLDASYDYLKQYIGENTVTKEKFQNSETFKINLLFNLTFINNIAKITPIKK